MLTAATTTVDAAPRAIMWSVSDIAARDGVSKQAVSKKVKELAALGLMVERDSQGRVAAVNVADYDRLRGRTDDPSKAQAPGRIQPAEAPAADNESYNEALRQKTWHESEMRRLKVAEIKGELLRKDALGEAITACGETIVAIIDRIPGAADDLAAAVSREGVHGLRVALKSLTSRVRAEIAEALAQIIASTPQPSQEDLEDLP